MTDKTLQLVFMISGALFLLAAITSGIMGRSIGATAATALACEAIAMHFGAQRRINALQHQVNELSATTLRINR